MIDFSKNISIPIQKQFYKLNKIPTYFELFQYFKKNGFEFNLASIELDELDVLIIQTIQTMKHNLLMERMKRLAMNSTYGISSNQLPNKNYFQSTNLM